MSCDYAEPSRQLPVPNVPPELSHNAQAAGCEYVCINECPMHHCVLCMQSMFNVGKHTSRWTQDPKRVSSMFESGENVWTSFRSKINSSKNPQVYLLLLVQGTTWRWQSKLLLKLWDPNLTRSRSFPSCSVSPAIISGALDQNVDSTKASVWSDRQKMFETCLKI